MTLTKSILTYLFLLLAFSMFGQNCGHISVLPMVEGKAIDTVQGNAWEGRQLRIEKLSFYIYLETKDSLQAKDVALFELSQGLWSRSYSSYGSLKLGVDSNLNALGVHRGDLDPLQGMYWSWQSGYIHFKLEGEWEQDGKMQPFVFHIGGFNSAESGPFELLQLNEINQLQYGFDVAPALNWAYQQKLNRIMSPGNKANAFGAELLKGFKRL